MPFVSDFESAIEYIEENLTVDIDFNMVAQKAKCSTYHFQRMFSSLIGIPLSEYIRRRRITLAAIEIQNSDTKIIDIALKYGYDSHSSFTRAFQLIQGVTPSKARIDGVPLMAYPPLTFQFILKGVEAMQYKIVETQPYKVFGMDVVQTDGWTPDKFLENADRVIENGSHDAINTAAGFPGLAQEMIAKNQWDVTKIHLLQAIHFWDEAGNRYFMYGWELPETRLNNQFKILEIPFTSWIVITVQLDGDRSVINRCYNDLYVNWFPTSGYEQAPGRPIIEKYSAKNAELWMPIIKK
ncbi:helix-turn-helix domain-containing protein [Lacrimispora sp. 38-1]|uniref:helix-turn-helix domain-containing protein n=1 Tax=Lacrimispora sp. 38-1 TaxID=3125778 RepID=UPI003CE7A93D